MANASRTAAVIVHPLGPSTGRWHPLCVYKSAKCSLSGSCMPRQQAFPFGEGGTPLGVTEEVRRHRNSPKCKCFRNLFTAPLPALRATLPKGEGLRQTAN